MQNVEVDAPSGAVWDVMADVERWPEVTESMTSVKRLEDAPLGVGTKVLVQQPKLKPVVYTVITYDEGRNFAWTANAVGVKTLAAHSVTPRADGKTTLALTLQLEGFLVPVARLYAGAMIQRYVAMEAAGIKRRAEEKA
jgi:uncharacterized membrane protein